ncbi:tRNA (guanine(46)-N(7))-methyltransferase TrmB [Pleionea sediminis]|uniref:tRNA (guanine(46)-N(7))-methyltransferase TrmB n=1 Tax=Pleionea sediminis TaxID=2569479 RepID=UPI00118645D3|nr:methyltransferase domain-containing protein [Pleionea sediminis]
MTESNSKKIESNQVGLNENLEQVVISHRDSDYKKPIQAHNQQGFDKFLKVIQVGERPMILDSCCGTGMSTLQLAEKFPEHWVIGIDQSEVRLSKVDNPLDNVLFVRANCEDFWRLCLQVNLFFEQHFILYPNPWPKKKHLQRRWHGHPVFPVLPQLSHKVELRSNWRIYLEEFSYAWKILTKRDSEPVAFQPENYLTLFEKKYAESGHDLFKLVVEK